MSEISMMTVPTHSSPEIKLISAVAVTALKDIELKQVTLSRKKSVYKHSPKERFKMIADNTQAISESFIFLLDTLSNPNEIYGALNISFSTIKKYIAARVSDGRIDWVPFGFRDMFRAQIDIRDLVRRKNKRDKRICKKSRNNRNPRGVELNGAT